ncbi:MAG: serine/threonine protein kinase, partial [Steroidobacter sp.]
YSAIFVGAANPLTVDLLIPSIDGVHVFEGTLAVGQNVNSAAPAGGDGPTLTVAAGVTLAFTDPADYVLINRGSQIIADGAADAPITFTSYTDAVAGTVGAEDVQQWGGIVINGNGITNNCSDAERAADQCHVVSEGQPSNYGGADNADNSGVLRYVVVKHTGFEVAPGDELNGVTFNAVGSGTVVENLQVYSTYDDGIEFFGGAVNVSYFVALYVRDDSIDYSDGYVGAVRNALVIHSATNGNRCIEADNVGDGRTNVGEAFDTPPISNPLISNVTCIPSNADLPLTTHDDSEGFLFRQGAQMQLADSIVFGGYGPASNECFEIGNPRTLEFAAAGDSTVLNTVLVCEEAAKGSFANTDTVQEWFLGANPSTNGANYSFNTGNVIITDAKNANVRVLEPGTFYTATAFADAAGVAFTVGTGQVGAVTSADDWTAGWTYGLHDGARAQPLWFE